MENAALGIEFLSLDRGSIRHLLLFDPLYHSPTDLLAKLLPSFWRARIMQEGGDDCCAACCKRTPRWPDVDG
jgi:hypothetical protein